MVRRRAIRRAGSHPSNGRARDQFGSARLALRREKATRRTATGPERTPTRPRASAGTPRPARRLHGIFTAAMPKVDEAELRAIAESTIKELDAVLNPG